MASITWSPDMNEQSPAEIVFFTALEKATPADRAAYLDEACAGDGALRRRVEALLAAHPQVGQFLERPVVEAEGVAVLGEVANAAAVDGPVCQPHAHRRPVAPDGHEAEAPVSAGHLRV